MVEIRKSICDICTPGKHCGLDVHVEDQTIVKITGAKDFPSKGVLCVKGLANEAYVNRKDRIKTPLKRVGAKGSDTFQEISWEEAYQEIAARLNSIKEQFSANQVAWFVGYEKWCRAWVQRLAYSFGSANYGTESSSCNFARMMAGITTLGVGMLVNDLAHTELFVGWGCDPYTSSHPLVDKLQALKARGGKIIIIDPKRTTTVKNLADLHIQIRPGTDGALALGIASYWIANGMYDKEYVNAYVKDFEELIRLAEPYTLEETSRITGVAKKDIVAMAKLYGEARVACAYAPPSSLPHHLNGFNAVRMIYILQALQGNIDVAGGDLPGSRGFCQTGCGFQTMEETFIFGNGGRPEGKRVGEDEFPLWAMLSPEMQAISLPEQILSEKPYGLKALVNFGMNHRMFPQPKKVLQALDKLDFVVSIDLFMTETCRHSDLVLPACSSLERSELKGWPGGFLTCTTPAIKPLYQSRPDTVIVCELAEYLGVEDDLLRSGYEETMGYMISNLSVTMKELRESGHPIRVKEAKGLAAGRLLKNGFGTKSGKIEISSMMIGFLRQKGCKLDPLPVYDANGVRSQDEDAMTLVSGARMVHTVHSRLHKVEELRRRCPDPLAVIHPAAAKAAGVTEGDFIEVYNQTGKIRLKAHISEDVRLEDVHICHGYEEADVNDLIPDDHRDPYSGYPGYRDIGCNIRKA